MNQLFFIWNFRCILLCFDLFLFDKALLFVFDILFDKALLFDGGSISRTVLYVKEILTGNLDHKMWGAAPMIVEGRYPGARPIGRPSRFSAISPVTKAVLCQSLSL